MMSKKLITITLLSFLSLNTFALTKEISNKDFELQINIMPENVNYFRPVEDTLFLEPKISFSETNIADSFRLENELNNSFNIEMSKNVSTKEVAADIFCYITEIILEDILPYNFGIIFSYNEDNSEFIGKKDKHYSMSLSKKF